MTNKKMRRLLAYLALFLVFPALSYFHGAHNQASKVGMQTDYFIEKISEFVSSVDLQDPKTQLLIILTGIVTAIVCSLPKMLLSFVNGVSDGLSKWSGEKGETVGAIAIINFIDKIRSKLSNRDSKYCEAQTSACERCRTEGLAQWGSVRIEDIFVPLRLSESRGGDDTNSIIVEEQEEEKNHFEIWDVIREVDTKSTLTTNIIFILAAVGFGKSSLLQHITLRYSKRKLPSRRIQKRIPILLTLRDIEDFEENNPIEFIITDQHIPSLPGGEYLGASVLWVRGFLRQGKGIILLDGFDEIATSKREKASSWIERQAKRYHKSLFIVTSRHEGFKSYRPVEQPVVLSIKSFNEGQRNKFIREWHFYREKERLSTVREPHRKIRNKSNSVSENLIKQINSSKELELMSRNPLLLVMIAHLNELYPGRVPRHKAKLYQKILALLLEDRPSSKGNSYLTRWQNGQRVLQWMAAWMASKEQYYFPLNKKMNRSMNDFIEENLSISGGLDFRRLIENFANTSQVVVVKEEYKGNSHERCEFPHQSFRDYLAAEEMVINSDSGLTRIIEHVEDPTWQEIIIFYAGIQDDWRKIETLIRVLCGRESIACVRLANQCRHESPVFFGAETRPKEELSLLLNNLNDKLMIFELSELEDNLVKRDWRKADESTYSIFINSVSKVEGDVLLKDDFQEISRSLLVAVDGLWDKYSQGRFGLKQQHRIYKRIVGSTRSERKVCKFAREVGWWREGRWLKYDDIDYTQSSSASSSVMEGYFPIATANAETKSISGHVGWENVIDRIDSISID